MFRGVDLNQLNYVYLDGKTGWGTEYNEQTW